MNSYQQQFNIIKQENINNAYKYMLDHNYPIDINIILDDLLSFKFMKASSEVVEYVKSEIENVLDTSFSKNIIRYALLLEDYNIDVRGGTIYISLIDEGLSSIEKLYDIGLILINDIDIVTKVDDKDTFIAFIKKNSNT